MCKMNKKAEKEKRKHIPVFRLRCRIFQSLCDRYSGGILRERSNRSVIKMLKSQKTPLTRSHSHVASHSLFSKCLNSLMISWVFNLNDLSKFHTKLIATNVITLIRHAKLHSRRVIKTRVINIFNKIIS